MSQSQVDRIERAVVEDLAVRRMVAIAEALGGGLNLAYFAPRGAPRVRDAAHARSVAYVARRLQRDGWLVATEVEVGAGRARGFVDVLAMHPTRRILLVIEVKTEIRDLGEIDRQIGVAERGAWDVAHWRGWRPWRVLGVLLVLATDENDRRLAEHRGLFDRQYRIRWRELGQVVAGESAPAEGGVARSGGARGGGARALAMIDPRSRRRSWLQASAIDGRRTAAPYLDRLAYLAGPRRP